MLHEVAQCAYVYALPLLSFFQKVRSMWGVIGSAIAGIGFAFQLYVMGALVR